LFRTSEVSTNIHNTKVPSDPQNFVAEQDLILNQLQYGVESGFVYWEMIKENGIADQDDVRALSVAG
jgi:hypothetical protein